MAQVSVPATHQADPRFGLAPNWLAVMDIWGKNQRMENLCQYLKSFKINIFFLKRERSKW